MIGDYRASPPPVVPLHLAPQLQVMTIHGRRAAAARAT
jgi:hypothetical protein